MNPAATTSEALALPIGVSERYATRPAKDEAEVRRAQRLRFQVFNLELGEGLEVSYRTGLDQDRFDAVCDHLLAIEVASGEVVGTYRLQTGFSAAAAGYYSEQEFDFSPYEIFRAEIIEVGRACVHCRHRNLAVLGVLWKGIAAYAWQRRARYLVGCSSLPTAEPAAAWSVFARLAGRHLAPAHRRTEPRPGWQCPLAPAPEIPYPVPKLMQAYLALGAEICGPPALDREFGSVDFLTWLDLERLPPSARRRFFP